MAASHTGAPTIRLQGPQRHYLTSHQATSLDDSLTPQLFPNNDPIAKAGNATGYPSPSLTAATPKASMTEWTENV